MLFARWRHHIRFASRFAYAPFNAMVTRISKWSRIQDSCRITPKIESLVGYAMLDILSKFQKDPSITLQVILLTHRQTNKQTNKQTKTGKNITSLAEVIILISYPENEDKQRALPFHCCRDRCSISVATASICNSKITSLAI